MDRILKWIGDIVPPNAYLGQETPPNQMNRHPGEIYISKPAQYIDINSPLVCNELVEKTIQLFRLKRGGDMPRNTNDLKIEMFSVFNKSTIQGYPYIERVWWLQVGHPYVPFIDAVINMRIDPRWEKLGMVGSSRLGIACVYTDDTITGMLKELVTMFKDQHYELEDLTEPEYDEEEDEEEEEEEEEEQLNSIIINVGTEKRTTNNSNYSVFGSAPDGSKKAD